MRKNRLVIRGNNKKNSVVNRHLQETSSTSFECFEDMVRGRQNHTRWSKDLEIRVEEVYRNGVYEPIYEELLREKGVVEGWARLLGSRYNIEWCELFSDFQLHLYNMLDGVADKAYNMEISFMNNLYKQLECVTKDKRKYLTRDKRKYDGNCIPKEELEQIKDISNDEYANSNLLISLRTITGLSNEDKQVLLGLAEGIILKNDIPEVLNWTNKDDRKKLHRYCKNLTNILIKHNVIVPL